MVQRSATKLSAVTSPLMMVGATLVAVTALVSCGNEQQDGRAAAQAKSSDRADRVVRQFYAAFARGDGDSACALLTKAAAEGLEQLPEGTSPSSCAKAVTVLRRNSLIPARPRVRETAIRGSTATVRAYSKRPAYDNAALLRRDANGWKIAFPPAIVTRFDSPPGIRPHDDEPHEDEGR